MQFQLDVILSEKDYLAFNQFHALQSEYGKKLIKKGRCYVAGCTALCAVLFLVLRGWTVVSAVFVIVLGLFTALYLLLYGKITKRIVKWQIKTLKKMGKLPFDAVSRLEFYEDKLVDISEGKRVEQSYDGLERICVIKDRFVLLYNSSMSANILPIPQLKEQLDLKEFLSFLSRKCAAVSYY